MRIALILNLGEMNTYKQLETTLNKCIELGRRKGVMHKAFISCDIDGIHFISRDESVERSEHLSYHDLFSKDSGLMEFVSWKESNICLGISYYNDEEEGYNIDYFCTKFWYMIMGPMTAEQKVQHFIDNAIVPNKSER